MIIAGPHHGNVIVAPCSAEPDMFDPNVHFRVWKSDDDFPATGLTRDSYIAGNRIQKIKIENLQERIGNLEGTLAKRALDWIGE